MADREFTNINGIKVCDQTARDNIPTKTSQLTNDSGYITNIPDEYITETELNGKGYATTSQIPTVPTNVSEFTNDANYASETYVSNKIAEAQLGGGSGSVDLSGYVTKETGNASQITFSDGQTFQAKLDAGTLKGEKGDTGERGPQGPAGADGLTTAISVNGSTYTHSNGTITLPNYPTVPTKISELTNDSNFVTSSEMTEAINNVQLGGTLNKIEVLEEDPTDNLYEGRIWIYKQPDLSCTGITLDNTTLTIDASTSTTATLTATVTPTNTTDTITWSVSPSNIATVNNGVITAKANGSAIITATCGAYFATCEITVSGITEAEMIMDGLQIWYKGSDFSNSEQTTTLIDNSSQGNNINATGFSYTNTSGANSDNNLVFDGVDDSLAIARNNISIDISYGFTIIFKGSINNLLQTNKEIVDMSMKKWESGSTGQQLSLIYGYVSNTVELFGDGLAFREGSQITIYDTNIHTIVYSYDGSTLKGYFDGSETISISKSLTMSLPIIEVGIGNNILSAQSRSYSNITLNNFLFYNKGLTSDEITSVCNNLV